MHTDTYIHTGLVDENGGDDTYISTYTTGDYTEPYELAYHNYIHPHVRKQHTHVHIHE